MTPPVSNLPDETESDDPGAALDDFATVTLARGAVSLVDTDRPTSPGRVWSIVTPQVDFTLTLISINQPGSFELGSIEQVGGGIRYTAATSADVGGSGEIPEQIDEMLRRMMTPAGSVALTGAAFSAGLLWWASRAGGLLASLALSLPTWRGLDPLNIVGRTQSNPDDWGHAQSDEGDGTLDDTAVDDLLANMSHQRR